PPWLKQLRPGGSEGWHTPIRLCGSRHCERGNLPRPDRSGQGGEVGLPHMLLRLWRRSFWRCWGRPADPPTSRAGRPQLFSALCLRGMGTSPSRNASPDKTPAPFICDDPAALLAGQAASFTGNLRRITSETAECLSSSALRNAFFNSCG